MSKEVSRQLRILSSSSGWKHSIITLITSLGIRATAPFKFPPLEYCMACRGPASCYGLWVQPFTKLAGVIPTTAFWRRRWQPRLKICRRISFSRRVEDVRRHAPYTIDPRPFFSQEVQHHAGNVISLYDKKSQRIYRPGTKDTATAYE